MPSLRRIFDVRPGERAIVLLSVAYMAVVVASFLLAKPIRNALFLRQYGAYNLVYVYAGVPIVLSLLVPFYEWLASRIGHRRMISASLTFFALNALFFWYAFRALPFPGLSGVFYIWVNSYGIIAPVQAWGLMGGLFDARQAKRIFGVIGAGASLGAIGGGLIASTLVGVVGGAQNLLLVLAALIGLAAALVTAIARPRTGHSGSAKRRRAPFSETLSIIRRDRYLRLITATVFFLAIVTQWSGFQLSLVADERFAGDADRLTRFFGQFNVAFGLVAFAAQLLATGPLLRLFGIVVTILLLPLALGAGSLFVFLIPGFWTVLMTNAADQTLRFSVDKAGHELLFLPLPPGIRSRVRGAIDVVVNRLADAVGAVLLGLATQGFVAGGGLGFGVRGTAAINLVFVAAWLAVALRLRSAYLDVIRDSIRGHRLSTERAAAATVLERSAAELLTEGLASRDPNEILYALDQMQADSPRMAHPALCALLSHESVDVRRRAIALLNANGDASVAGHVEPLLTDDELEVRTEALLFLVHHTRIDPLEKISELGDVAGFSIRAGLVAYLAHPGPAQNLDAARAILDAMVREDGDDAARTRLEAVRLLDRLPDAFDEELAALVADPDQAVAREAIRAAGRRRRAAAAPALLRRLAETAFAHEAADALAAMGDAALPLLRERLLDAGTRLAIRREIPGALARIGSAGAEQVLLESLLQPDTSLRHRVIAALNKRRQAHADLRLDPDAIDELLVAEITGHYRSYQVLGAMSDLDPRDPVIVALKQSMDREIERIFRLMGLLLPRLDIYSVYVALRSSDARIRANALEWLENVLEPQLRSLVLPLVDPQVGLAERARLANRLVGAPVDTLREALKTLLSSEDSWLKSCAAYAVGDLGLDDLQADLDRWAEHEDPLVRETVNRARRKLTRADEADQAADEERRGWETTGSIGFG